MDGAVYQKPCSFTISGDKFMGETKKFFVVSDIHGHCTILKEALAEAGFDRNNNDHMLVCCGDLFDRGPENMKVLKFIDAIDNKILIMGNHDERFLEIFRTGKLKEHDFDNGTAGSMVEFFGKYAVDGNTGDVDFSGNTRTVDRISDLIGEMRDYFETEHYVFTHGWLPTVVRDGKPVIYDGWRTASPSMWSQARWKKWPEMYGEDALLEDKTIVCGHYPAIFANIFDRFRKPGSSEPFCDKGIIAIDAGTYTSGRINVLVLEDKM